MYPEPCTYTPEKERIMPNAPKTPHRQVRVDDELWIRFDAAVHRAGAADRSTVLRDFIRWYVRDIEDGKPVRMPKRPDTA
jgi:hypothetical protein